MLSAHNAVKVLINLLLFFDGVYSDKKEVLKNGM